MSNNRDVQSRNTQFAEKIETRIWQEAASPENPYIAEGCRCHGYDLQDLMAKCSYVEAVYLLFRGELPRIEHAELLQQLMIAMMNPGPRNPATRASMIAGVGKTDTSHLLPIGLMVLGGEHLGSACMEETVRFFRKNQNKDPKVVVKERLQSNPRPAEGDWHPLPGFGSHFGGRDHLYQKIADQLIELPGSGKALRWGADIAEILSDHNLGWLSTGLVAATLADLGFHPKQCGGIFQLLCSPGLLAHGLEMANKPLSAMPFPKDEDYTIEK